MLLSPVSDRESLSLTALTGTQRARRLRVLACLD
jgi:hypothetical protein